MDTSQIGLQVFETISPIVPVAVSWLSVRIALLDKIRAKNENLQGVLARLDDAVFNAVSEVEQTSVRPLRATRANRRLTVDDATTARNAAIASVKSQLGPKGITDLIKLLGIKSSELEKVLTTRVEAAVNELTIANSTPPPTAADAQPFAA